MEGQQKFAPVRPKLEPTPELGRLLSLTEGVSSKMSDASALGPSHIATSSTPCDEDCEVTAVDFTVEVSEHCRRLELESDDRAPATARAFTRETLSQWGLDDLLDRSLLIVSELTTNAERHGRTPDSSPEPERERIVVTLAARGGVVGIEVEDGSPSPPILQPSSPEAIDGRGLLLVEAEADYWTAEPHKDGSGKRVLAIVKRQRWA